MAKKNVKNAEVKVEESLFDEQNTVGGITASEPAPAEKEAPAPKKRVSKKSAPKKEEAPKKPVEKALKKPAPKKKPTPAKKEAPAQSTVHKDVTERLDHINANLAHEVRKVLDLNKAERHIRGGLATKEKYAHMHMI